MRELQEGVGFAHPLLQFQLMGKHNRYTQRRMIAGRSLTMSNNTLARDNMPPNPATSRTHGLRLTRGFGRGRSTNSEYARET